MGKSAFGTAAFSQDGGGYGVGKCEDVNSLVEYALEHEINTFDTAPIYGFGKAELELGRCIKNIREKVKVIDKSGVGWHSSKRVNMSNDPKLTLKMFEDSLRRLDTEYIDTYMIHWPDDKVDIRYPMEVLSQLKYQGKIKSIGLSNTTTKDLRLAQQIDLIELVQMQCNLFENAFDHIELEKGQTRMGWGTFDKGILAKSVSKNRKFSKDDARSWAPWWKKSNWKSKVSRASKYDESLFDYALHYSLKHCDYALCGPKTINQLKKLIHSWKTKVNYDEVEKIKNEI